MEQVAPRIWRVGSTLVNSYVVEDGGAIVLVDGGLPAYFDDLMAGLQGIGRSFDDVRGVLLTHGHDDHVGYAERARRSGATVRIHELDAALARGEIPNRIGIWGPKRPRPIVQFLAFAVRRGYFRVPKVSQVVTFDDGATLDVPGSPQVVHVPGHTPGSAALHFPGHDAVFVGDALNTYAVTSGRSGPQLSPFNLDRDAALASLGRLEAVPATHVLPGHGVPWSGGAAEAVTLARVAAGAR